MRKPLVLIMAWRIGRARTASRMARVGMQRRLAARNLDQVGFAFARDQGIEHALDGRERKVLFPRRR
jgi:hypothetical protein